MGWIKRNLGFTIGGIIALLLLGAAGYYVYTRWSHKNAAQQQLEEVYKQLQDYYNKHPTPSDDNIAAAQKQEQDLRDWIGQAQTYFVPVPPIPNPSNGVVTTEAFAGSLRKAIYDMQQEAVAANVELPPDYSFSFAAERNLVTFTPGSLNPLASHLGEVRAICEVLFAAKINALDGIQREIVSDNDTAGPQSDYLTDKTRTPDATTTITPYMVTFRCFSSDLADVLSRLASSDHCLLVTGINVMPAGAAAAADANSQGGNPNGNGNPQNPPNPANGGLQTALDEQLLRVTLGVEVVKLSKQ